MYIGITVSRKNPCLVIDIPDRDSFTSYEPLWKVKRYRSILNSCVTEEKVKNDFDLINANEVGCWNIVIVIFQKSLCIYCNILVCTVANERVLKVRCQVSSYAYITCVAKEVS